MRETIVTSRGKGWSTTGVPWLVVITLAGMTAGWGIVNSSEAKVLAVGLALLCSILAAWKIDLALYGVGIFLVLLQEGETTPGTVFALLEKLNKPNIPSLLEVLFALIAAGFFLRHFLLRAERYSLRSIKVPLALFFLLLFIALAHGINEGTDFIFRKEDFKKFLFPVLFFVCAVNILDTREKITRLLSIMFWVMLIKTYLAVFYYLRGMGFPYGENNVVFIESGDQTLLTTALVVGISLLAARNLKIKSWLFMLWGLAPILFALIFSYRRNAMWGTLFSLGLLFLLSEGKLKVRMLKIFAVSGGCAFLLMALVPKTNSMSTLEFMKDRLTSVIDPDQGSNVAHLGEWRVTVEDTMQRPFFGLGLGSIHSPVPESEGLNQHTVHNAFLMLWMKMGLFALLLLLWCLFRYCRLGVTEALRRRDPVLTGLFATIGLWMIAMNVGPSWYYYRESCLMALIMAVVARLATFGPEAAALPSCPKPEVAPLGVVGWKGRLTGAPFRMEGR